MGTLSSHDILALNRAIGDIYAARELESFYRSVLGIIQVIIPCEQRSSFAVSLPPPCFLKVISCSHGHSLVSGKNLQGFNTNLHEYPLNPPRFYGHVVKTADYASLLQFTDTAIQTKYYRYFDVDTQINFSISLSPEKVTLFALSRRNPNFTERDRLILSLLRPHLIIALQNAADLCSIRRERELLQRVTGEVRRGYGLSSRESEVLTWLSAGKTNVEIAIILSMSKRTAEKHLENIFVKLGVTTRIAAAAIMRGRQQ